MSLQPSLAGSIGRDRDPFIESIGAGTRFREFMVLVAASSAPGLYLQLLWAFFLVEGGMVTSSDSDSVSDSEDG